MSEWIIETERNYFSASSIEEVIKNIIEFCVHNKYDSENIISVYFEENGEILQQLPSDEIKEIENEIEEEVSEWKQDLENQRQDLEDLRSDYYANLI